MFFPLTDLMTLLIKPFGVWENMIEVKVILQLIVNTSVMDRGELHALLY